MTKNEQYWEDAQDALTRVLNSLDINSSQYEDLLSDVQNIRGFINKHKPKDEGDDSEKEPKNDYERILKDLKDGKNPSGKYSHFGLKKSMGGG